MNNKNVHFFFTKKDHFSFFKCKLFDLLIISVLCFCIETHIALFLLHAGEA